MGEVRPVDALELRQVAMTIGWGRENDLKPVRRRKGRRSKSRKPAGKPEWGFYGTSKWRSLRYRALQKYGNWCSCCKSEQAPLHVDHIKPRSKYPELEYDINNLQILCKECNLGKSDRDNTDWRDLPTHQRKSHDLAWIDDQECKRCKHAMANIKTEGKMPQKFCPKCLYDNC